jgi:predicted nuclease of predicted toxin-antitoxin system
MKVLLDECVPRKLKNSLVGHECQTVPEVGMAGRKNGELLALAREAGFEVFVTVDRGIEYEQSLASQDIAVVVLRAKSSRFADLLHNCARTFESAPLYQEQKSDPREHLI